MKSAYINQIIQYKPGSFGSGESVVESGAFWILIQNALGFSESVAYGFCVLSGIANGYSASSLRLKRYNKIDKT